MIERNIKEEKEAFVTGHAGTTLYEIMWLSLAGPLGIVLCQYLYNYLYNYIYQQQQRQLQSSSKFMLFCLLLIVEAITIFIPMIIVQSNFLYPYGSIIIIIQIILIFYFRYYYNNLSSNNTTTTTKTTSSTTNKKEESSEPASSAVSTSDSKLKLKLKLDYLTAYRSILMVMTFIAILAVDFHIFPRRFAKTETYGYGLMDLGAASFAISAGLVSTKSRSSRRYDNDNSNNNNAKKNRNNNQNSNNNNNNKFLLHVLPLIIIGIIRIITNKELDYQEHVSEYGVHWNFFFTLGVIAIIPRFIDDNTYKRPTWILPTLLMTIYQFSLSIMGFQQFIENAPRSCDHLLDNNNPPFFLSSSVCDILYANREGILGCFGYLSLYFYGEWIGFTYFWNTTTGAAVVGETESSSSTTSSSWSLEKLCLGGWILLGVMTTILKIPVSRRSTNVPFCLWSMSHNILLLILLKHLVLKKQPSSQEEGKTTVHYYYFPIVMERMNRYGLILFLIANLLTGLVNLTVPTLDVSDGWALLILFGYISSVGIVALILDYVITPLLRSSSSSKSLTNETNAKEAKKSD